MGCERLSDAGPSVLTALVTVHDASVSACASVIALRNCVKIGSLREHEGGGFTRSEALDGAGAGYMAEVDL